MKLIVCADGETVIGDKVTNYQAVWASDSPNTRALILVHRECSRQIEEGADRPFPTLVCGVNLGGSDESRQEAQDVIANVKDSLDDYLGVNTQQLSIFNASNELRKAREEQQAYHSGEDILRKEA